MPFAGYRDFDDCVAKNQDKRNPKAYCGAIQSQAEGALVAVAVDDGTTVRALAVGWDGRSTDDTDWALDRTDLPLLTTQIGTLVITHVADLDYDQFTVNGIPVDPDTIQPLTDFGLVASLCASCGLPRQVGALVAAGSEHVPRDPYGKWCKGAQCQGVTTAGGLNLKDDDDAWQKYQKGVITADEYLQAHKQFEAQGSGAITPDEIMLPDGTVVPQAEYDAFVAAKAADPVDDWAQATANETGIMPVEVQGLIIKDQAQADQYFETGFISHQQHEQATSKFQDQAYAKMSPGQKAAYTKKQNAAKADEQAKLAAQANMTSTLEIKSGMPLSNANDLSDENVDLYIATHFPTKGPDPGASAADRKAWVKARNVQHMQDQSQLVNEMGYQPGKPGGPVESRRALLRETGHRRATGGPKTDHDVHEFYTDEQINSMSRDKLDAVVLHHTGGVYTKDGLAKWPDQSVREVAINANSGYRANVETLQAKGYSNAQIPHSNHSTNKVVNGQATGFAGADGKYGPTVAPHGPKVQKVTAAPIVKPIVNMPTPAAKPADWESWSPGKKAAWTKKQNQAAGITNKIQTTIPHPADWESWSPGKKAAWTKKHKVGGVVTTHPVGQHTTIDAGSGYYGSKTVMSKQIESFEAPYEPHYYDRWQAFDSATTQESYDANYAWSNYTGGGYVSMNGYLRYGSPSDANTVKQVNLMKDLYHTHGSPAPPILERGKYQSKSGFKEMSWEVGGVYEEKGFWSGSTSRGTSGDFGTRVYMRVHTNGANSLPGNQSENETILPPGTQFRVLNIVDIVGGGETSRYLEVEVVV